jgi:metal-sulfur cluster biosynthetic enzyme
VIELPKIYFMLKVSIWPLYIRRVSKGRGTVSVKVQQGAPLCKVSLKIMKVVNVASRGSEGVREVQVERDPKRRYSPINAEP